MDVELNGDTTTPHLPEDVAEWAVEKSTQIFLKKHSRKHGKVENTACFINFQFYCFFANVYTQSTKRKKHTEKLNIICIKLNIGFYFHCIHCSHQ